MALVAGLDGCSAGWLCVLKDLVTGQINVRILANITAVVSLNPRPDLLTVDVPIGLTNFGPRVCDLRARILLRKPRSSSVFPAPIRPTLAAQTYPEACQIGQSVDGRKLNKQTWAILSKIREVDAFLRSDASLRKWIREVHPEVCFCFWNNGVAMGHRKKSPLGRAEREGLVIPLYNAAYLAAQRILPRGIYKNDDLLDAFAALWSAERAYQGQAVTLPANPPTDSLGLRMEIVA